MTELKPCPFCGGEARIESTSFMGELLFRIGCSEANCRGRINGTHYESKQEAINAWNTRVERTDSVEKIALDVLDSFCRAISEDGCAYKQKGFSKVYVGLIGCKKDTCIVKKFADRLLAQGIEVPE